MPIGQFASCSATDQQAGMAGQGLTINLSAGYRVAGPIGLMIRGEQHRNTLQTQGLLDALYRNDTDLWTAKADNWSVTSVMAGPYISLPMGRFSVDARILVGRATAVLPNTTMSGNFGQTEMAVETTGSTSTATAYGSGLSLRYRVGRSFSFHVNGDYTHSQFTFNNLTSTAWSNNRRSESSSYSSDRTIGIVSVSAGVTLLFGNSYHPF